MQNQPLLILLMAGIGGYVIKLWIDDYRARKTGTLKPGALPGTTSAPTRAVIIASAGALALLAAETWGEHALGIAGEQSKMTVLFAVYTLVAAVVEEIIFRGYIVIENKGRAALWAGIFAASILFAVIHPHLWSWENNTLSFHFDTKAWFTTGMLFSGSLWFYFVRFGSFNPQRSLIPCFAAHAAKNLGVIVVKGSTGFLQGWF